jgi:RNA polymerase sigma-70 factor, ECF subfamily
VARGTLSSLGAPPLVSLERSIDLATVFREHGPFVHRVLHRLGVHPADVDDAFQEVFVVIHRRLPDFEPDAAVRPWVYGICARVASRQRRRRSTSREVGSEEASEPVDPTTPIDSITAKQAREVLSVILDQIDDDKRAVYVLHELEELSIPEIAQSLDCPAQTAYSRLRAARAAVADAVRRYRLREGL